MDKFIEYKNMYCELLEIVRSCNSKELERDSTYNNWLTKIKELKKSESDLLRRKELLFDELEDLSYVYVRSKGEETGLTKIYHAYFKNAFNKR
jgi:hypothetical protein